MGETGRRVLQGVVVMGGLLAASAASAQTLGTLRWQLQPYCNAVIVTVTPLGGSYTLDGFDDQCGAAQRAPLVGLATPNPDGSIAFGFTIATSSGAAVAVQATIGLATLGGPWRDSQGQSGTLAFNATAAGSPRPVLPPVGAGSPTTFTVPQTFAAGLSAGGARVTSVGAPTAPSDAATRAYVDAAVPPVDQFTFRSDGGFVARGAASGTGVPETGAGARMMWYPGKFAFRAGLFTAEETDAAIGLGSAAFGWESRAGFGAFAAGERARALGLNSLAIGRDVLTNAPYSVSLGARTAACGTSSVAMGIWVATASAPTVTTPCGGTAHDGAFIFGDLTTTYFATVANNEFAVRASGGVRLRTSPTASTGCNLAAGSGVWTCTSDRASKEAFEALDGDDVLRRLAAMPIERWSYKSEPGVRHVGPTAQDFHAAFGLGADETAIGHLDLSGISLRAIQALEARTVSLQRDNDALRARLDRLEALLAVPR